MNKSSNNNGFHRAMEAMEAVKKGAKAKRAIWNNGEYVYYDNAICFANNNGAQGEFWQIITPTDWFSEDWIIFDNN